MGVRYIDDRWSADDGMVHDRRSTSPTVFAGFCFLWVRKSIVRRFSYERPWNRLTATAAAAAGPFRPTSTSFTILCLWSDSLPCRWSAIARVCTGERAFVSKTRRMARPGPRRSQGFEKRRDGRVGVCPRLARCRDLSCTGLRQWQWSSFGGGLVYD